MKKASRKKVDEPQSAQQRRRRIRAQNLPKTSAAKFNSRANDHGLCAEVRIDAEVFTDYIRSLSHGEPDALDKVLEKLRRLLRSQMKRRNLWNRSFITNEFEDRLHDCFIFVFFGEGKKSGQLAYLVKRVEHGDSIDAIVHQRVKWFSHDLHRKLFPEDAAVYRNLKLAIQITADAIGVTKDVLCGWSDGADQQTIRSEHLLDYVANCPHWKKVIPTIRNRNAASLTSEAIMEMVGIGIVPIPFDDLLDSVLAASARVIPPSPLGKRDPMSFARNVVAVPSEAACRIELCEHIEEIMGKLQRPGQVKQEMMRKVLETLVDPLRRSDKITVSEMAESIGISRQLWNYYVVTLRKHIVTHNQREDEEE